MVTFDLPPSCFLFEEGDNTNSNSTSHVEEEIRNINLADDLTLGQQEVFHRMLLACLPVVSTGDKDVGECSSTPIRIKLYDETPIYQRVRRFSPPITEAIEEQCKELYDLDIIEPSISPWSSPVVPVRKPDGSLRLCVDYRKLNKVTIPDRFPMPNLSDSIFSLHGIMYFTSLDLVRGYYQLPLAEESKDLTAFSTPHGHWQFKRLSFGLKNAPAVFQREMQRILKEFPKCRVIIYIDDILILGRNFEEHIQLVERVLKVLQEHGLKIKISKCSWVQKEVKFLGHLVGRDGVRKLPEYIKKVEEFPKPTTVRELRRFLGLVNFQRKFVPNCSAISKPLSCLTGGRKSLGQRKISWTEEMEESFDKLKTLIKKEILLSYPDYSTHAKPLELFVDASGDGAGACLCQEQDGLRTTIAYDSMTFLDCETRYSTIERELAALRWGVKTFRPFLYGQYFIIHTDHRPLMYLQDMKMVDSRLSRTLEELSEYDFVVRYCPGEQNAAADFCSRLPGPSLPSVPDHDLSSLPAGLKVYREMKGGPSSLIDSLYVCLEHLYEVSNLDVKMLARGRKLREQLVDQFLKDYPKLGFKLDKNAKNRIRAMKQPSCAVALELLLSASKIFCTEIWVHFGPSNPVVFCDPSVNCSSRIHIQCLAGVHFNPIVEFAHFNKPEDYSVGAKVLKSKIAHKPDMGELENPQVSNIFCTEEDISWQPITPICSHGTDHVAQCIIVLNGIPYCALVDSGAQISLVSKSVVNETDSLYDPDAHPNVLKGLFGGRSEVLGAISATVCVGEDLKVTDFPFAVVPASSLNYCIILGLNFLRRAKLSLNFASNSILGVNWILVIFDSRSACTKISNSLLVVSCIMSMDELLSDEMPSLLLSRVIPLETLLEMQRSSRPLQKVKMLILSGAPVSSLPKSYQQFRKVWQYLEVQHDMVLKRDQYGKMVCVVSFFFLIEIVSQLHIQHLHIGMNKMIIMMKRLVWHHSLVKVVKDLCRSCGVCQKCKVYSRVVNPATLRISTASPFELVAMDLISLPTTSNGYVGCLMTVDHYSKWVSAIPIRNKQSRTICKALENNVLPSLPRIPVRILTDNGPEFTSEEFKILLERYNIVHVRTTPYKPASNGAIERVNRTIGELLRILTKEPRNWDDNLSKAILAYNHTPHSEIGSTPAERILRLSYDVSSLPLLSADIKHPWAEGHPRYQPFKVGSLVLKKTILVGNLSLNKLMPRFEGPYQVLKVNPNKVTYSLVDLESGKMVKAHHVQLKTWYEPPAYIKNHFRNRVSDPSQVTEIPTSIDEIKKPIRHQNLGADSSDDSDSWANDSVELVLLPSVQGKPQTSKSGEIPKSILKRSYTYDRKLSLRRWEELYSAKFDPTPILEPTSNTNEISLKKWEEFSSEFDPTPILVPISDPSIASNFQLSSSMPFDTFVEPAPFVPSLVPMVLPPYPELTSTILDGRQIQLLEDWDVSSIESCSIDQPDFYRLVNITFPDKMTLEVSTSVEAAQQTNTNPFLNGDGSIRNKQELDIEISALEIACGISFKELAGEIWPITSPGTRNSVNFTLNSPENLVLENQSNLTENISLDFSGFSGRVETSNYKSPIKNIMSCQDKASVLGRSSKSLDRKRVSLSPVLKEISEARRQIRENRQKSRSRLLQLRRKLEFSPPLTRSRGKAIELPNVQPFTLERKVEKRF